ncbi:MAG: serine protease, partial [Gammaproteobacteria bacterium]|nr:serine protease [Gammaproteobacteria bacterium]
LITEAETIWITDARGRAYPGCVLGYDQETGLGIVQALQKMDLPPLPIGRSSEVRRHDPMLVVGAGDDDHCVEAGVIAKREFAGYWEYLLDEAIFTAPAHPNWGGAALVNAAGELCGIGSLLVQQVAQSGDQAGANMIVPIDLLQPIWEDLRTCGRPNRPARPWLGMLVQDIGEHLVVSGVYDGGPAEKAGIEVGDLVVAVSGQRPKTLANLWRSIWKLGPAGTEIPLIMSRKGEAYPTTIESQDRNTRLKVGQIH